jgi:hypothetical protein
VKLMLGFVTQGPLGDAPRKRAQQAVEAFRRD